MQTLKGVLLISFSAVAISFGVNAVRPHPLPLGYGKPAAQTPASQQAPVAEPLFISLAELRDAPKDSLVIIDARSELFFKLGHIPRAINVSRKEFARDFSRAESILRKATGHKLAVYCSDEDCDDALLVARELLRVGLKSVHVFRGGWNAWQAAALPEEQG